MSASWVPHAAQNSASFPKKAITRLQKELAKSVEVQERQQWEVTLIDEELAQWNVLLKRDGFVEGPLKTNLTEGFRTGVLLRIEFSERYPFDPPFVRVESPSLKGGFVMTGGALCMEILTRHGWRPSVSMENVLETIRFHLSEHSVEVAGKLKVSFNRSEALAAFNRVVQIHGWDKAEPAKSTSAVLAGRKKL